MAEEKKNKGLFARLFGTQSSRCCGMQIEEMGENVPIAQSEDVNAVKQSQEQASAKQDLGSENKETEKPNAPT